MAQFRGSIQGQRGEASRLGSGKSGLKVVADGWNVGVSVCAHVNDKGEDEFVVSLTGGSNGRGGPQHIGTFTGADLYKR